MKLRVKLPFTAYAWLQRVGEANGLTVNQQLLAVLEHCRSRNRSVVHPDRRVVEVRTTPELEAWLQQQRSLSDLSMNAIVEEMVVDLQRDRAIANPWRRFR